MKLDSECLFCHSCMFYETYDEQISNIGDIFVKSLHDGKKCVYVASDNSVDDVRDGLVRYGGGFVKKTISDGSFEILSKHDVYFSDGVFDAEVVFNRLKELIENYFQAGYAGFVVTGEMSWSQDDIPGVEDLLHYEMMLNDMKESENVTLICQYKRKLYPSIFLKIQERIHPNIFSGGSIAPSSLYVGNHH